MGAPLEELNNVEENQKSQKNIRVGHVIFGVVKRGIETFRCDTSAQKCRHRVRVTSAASLTSITGADPDEPAQTPRQQQQDEAGPEDVTAGRENREDRELENRQFLLAVCHWRPFSRRGSILRS
ncbi:hypothetical protein NQZ68_023201 [Dissostichus eleginoides]|nr:hypothetical protein NQZ68_023201 [Dissostichus eleginoides]